MRFQVYRIPRTHCTIAGCLENNGDDGEKEQGGWGVTNAEEPRTKNQEARTKERIQKKTKEEKMKKKVLFVCVENSNRSQMSQAFAKLYGGEDVEAYSAGSKPSGIVNPKAIAAMKELGYDLGTHKSKSLEEVKQFAPFDAVVTMGCGDACPWMPAKKFIDWEIPDPKNMGPAEFNKVRDLIRNKIKELLFSI